MLQVGATETGKKRSRRRFRYLHIGEEAIKAATKFNQQAYKLSPGLDTSKMQSNYTEELDADLSVFLLTTGTGITREVGTLVAKQCLCLSIITSGAVCVCLKQTMRRLGSISSASGLSQSSR
jgi:hypothetical protein